MLESLERRCLLSTSVTSFHNDPAATGANTSELQLTPTNVKTGSFGKLFATAVDGNVYAQPLVRTGVTIAGSAHDVVFAATENDSLYAIDTGSGNVLWQRTFTSLSNSGGILNNTLGASAIAPVSSADVGATDISPNIGITGTPVIDVQRNLIYLVAKTKETIGGVSHFVQRLHAISMANGTDATSPFLIGDTTGTNTNSTSVYVYGSGDGAVTDPYNGTGRQVVQFNALHESQRASLSLVNNTVYVAWASHGDNGPYHGWILSWNVSNVTSSGFRLTGVLNTSPNQGAAGIWESGGAMAFESDGSAFYFLTGNGTGGAPTLDSNGMPNNGNYNEALVKAIADPSTAPTNQNINGWGLKVSDYFIPYNVAALDGADSDFGSGGPVLLPDSAGIAGHAHLLVAGGKDGRLFVLDRDHLGHFSASGDNALNSVPTGNGPSTPPAANGGTLSTPAFYNGKLYVVSGYSTGGASAYSLTSSGSLSTTSTTGESSFGYLPGSPSVSANGSNNGIVWLVDRQLNVLRAYDARTLSTELWNSAQSPNGSDALGAAMKFGTPTVANGEVFVGTTNSLVTYGLTPAPTNPPAAPVQKAPVVSGTSASLAWTDPSQTPNIATGYIIEDSTDNVNFASVTTAAAGATSIGIGGLSAQTKYYFRIRGFNSTGSSPASNTVIVQTTAPSNGINLSGGFASASGVLTVNPTASIKGSNLQLTDLGAGEAGSAFSSTPQDVTSFNSQFDFQVSAGANTADGFTFAIQNAGANAVGVSGGGLGYATINNSVAIKFDLYSNSGEGPDSTGLYSNGAQPDVLNSIDLSTTGINLHSGDPIRARMSYNGTTLAVTLTDLSTSASATQNYTVNIPALVGNNVAYIGFTGGTGGIGAVQQILNWTYTTATTISPGVPSGLGATPASATSVNVNWTNNGASASGFYLDRATDAAFTQNLINETLSTTGNTYTDVATGLAPGSTFYYRIRAFNSAGTSGNSNSASVTIPVAPPKPTAQTITNVKSDEIDMSWQDNAGHAADGYKILRAVNHGSFVLVATLPPTSRPAPSQYNWSDTNLTAGTYYEYHIQAYNVAGTNDFAGVNATTLTLPPANLQAVRSGQNVNLSWSAASGAVSYSLYRGTTAGGESTTPIATGVTTPSYVDTPPTSGTYFYEVTAVNPNAAYAPPLPAESAASSEASTLAPATAKLAGIVIGTTGSYDGVSTRDKVFDGSLNTFFDAAVANGNWAGLDLGSAYTITSIRYAPRANSGFASEQRMVGGIFQASNTADFSSGTVNLYTVASTPADGFTAQSIGTSGSYRYVRYLSPNGSYGNVAEVEFYGTSAAPADTQAPTAPGTPVAGTVTTTTAQMSWAASTDNIGVDHYVILRNGVSAGTSLTTSFTDSNLTSGTAYSYSVTAVDAAGNVSAASGSLALSTATGGTGTPTKLTGTIIGTTGSYDGTSTRDKAFDGNVSTFFDAAAPDNDYVGLDLGTAGTISSVTFTPRAGFNSRMVGGVFQGSNDATFSTGVITLATITTAPATGSTTLASNSSGTFRYVRYLAPSGSYGNVAEVQFNGTPGTSTPPPATGTLLTGTGVGTAGSYDGISTFAKALDGDLSTFFDAATPNNVYVGLDLGSTYTISSISFAPRVGFESRMAGGIFQGSNAADFSNPVTLGTIASAPPDGLNSLAVTNGTPFRFVRYLGPANAYGNIAELKFYGASASGGTTPASSKLAGAVIGTSGSYDGVSTIAKAFDGSASTFFDAAGPNNSWAGLDLGTTRTITSILFTPRAGFESRMTGGIFQASSTPDFSSNVTALYTIAAAPTGPTTISITPGSAYRYVRYLSPAGSYGNVAELEFDGY